MTDEVFTALAGANTKAVSCRSPKAVQFKSIPADASAGSGYGLIRVMELESENCRLTSELADALETQKFFGLN